MLRRDYLLKLIQDMFAAIAALLEREGTEAERQKQIEALYATFGADRHFFRSADEADMVAAVARNAAEVDGRRPDEVPPDELTKRTELLAALLYADFKVSDLAPALRFDVALRALMLYARVCEQSDTYDAERFERINELTLFIKQ